MSLFIKYVCEYLLNTGEVRDIKIHQVGFFLCRSLESSGRGRYMQMTKMQLENGMCHEKLKIVECEECHKDTQLPGYLPRASQIGPLWGHLVSETWFYWGAHGSSGPWVWSVLIHKRSRYKWGRWRINLIPCGLSGRMDTRYKPITQKKKEKVSVNTWYAKICKLKLYFSPITLDKMGKIVIWKLGKCMPCAPLFGVQTDTNHLEVHLVF